MVVLSLESVSPSLRGELTRWMLEPRAGVFVGALSALVRDKLWEKACQKAGEGGCLMLYSANNEQGFEIRYWGKTKRCVTDWDGLKLITHPAAVATKKHQRLTRRRKASEYRRAEQEDPKDT